MKIDEVIENFKKKCYLPSAIEEIVSNDILGDELIKIVRPLTRQEIATLKEHGNICSDWKQVLVEPDFTPNNIVDNRFSGLVVLGSYSGKEIIVDDDITFPSGIYHSVIKNCYIDSDALLKNNTFIANCYISSYAVVCANDMIYAKGESTFGNGQTISVGSEMGGRDIPLYVEQDIINLQDLITGENVRTLNKQYNEFVDSYSSSVKSRLSIISEHAKVINNRKIINCYIGEYAAIDNTTKIENSTILSSKKQVTAILDGVILENALCQWGVNIETLAIIQNSLLCEHSGVERHGKVKDSIIGSNTCIGEGEVTSSLIGPFVGMHHQSMLIGSIWVEGRGNIGYGANVGSNHTGKLPDQELFCGEGVFYGLGCNIKFPADYRLAAYSVIATGVTTLPQKVTFPFSLICEPFVSSNLKDISPAYNEIIPAWVLSDNAYAVFRNENKFLTRNKAKNLKIDFSIFRDDIVLMMIKAMESLKQMSGKEYYTDKDYPGLGKNILSENNRIKAIDSYLFYIKYYYYYVLATNKKSNICDDIKAILDIKIENSVIDEYKHILDEVILKVKESKQKDVVRGNKIIDDYSQWHTNINDDQVIKDLERRKCLI